MARFVNRWTLTALALVVIIAVAAGVIASRYSPAQTLVITLSPSPQTVGRILINGDVSAPGWYDLAAGDSIDSLLSAAGASSGDLALMVGAGTTGEQKVDINTAGAWLLQALPGIGEGRAEAIIAYRETHGLFRDIDELITVEGIGPALLEDIRHLITAGE